jgi:hypothetical protein
MPWLKSLVAGLSPQKLEFEPKSVHVGFVVEALGHFSQSF